MNLYNLVNNMRSRYFSMLEYLNNGFEIFKMFVKKHPLLVFSHFVFSTVMVLFITFPFTEQAVKMYEFAKKVNNTKMKKNININEYDSLPLEGCLGSLLPFYPAYFSCFCYML